MVLAYLIFFISFANAFIHSKDKISINIDFKNPLNISEIENNSHIDQQEDPYFKNLFQKVTSYHWIENMVENQTDILYKQLYCQNIIDVSDKFDYKTKSLFAERDSYFQEKQNNSSQNKQIPGTKGWGTKQKMSSQFDFIDDSSINELIQDVEELPGVEKNSPQKFDHLKFMKVKQEVGEQLISPLNDICFSQTIDIWEYKFCINKGVYQYNTQNYSEQFKIGEYEKPKQNNWNQEPWTKSLFSEFEDYKQSLEKLKTFVYKHSQKIDFDSVEFPMNELMKIDQSGRVIKSYITPEYSDKIGVNEFAHIESQSRKQSEYQSLLRITLLDQADFGKSLNKIKNKQLRFIERHIIFTQIVSISPNHIEQIHILGDNLNPQPLPQNLRENSKFFHNNQYTLQPTSKKIVRPSQIQEERYFQIFEDGILICHSRDNIYQFQPELCDLYKETNQGDTLIFQVDDKIYSSIIQRYISRGIIQLSDKKLIPKIDNLNSNNDLEDFDDDENFKNIGEHSNQYLKINQTDPLILSYLQKLPSLNKSVQWDIEDFSSNQYISISWDDSDQTIKFNVQIKNRNEQKFKVGNHIAFFISKLNQKMSELFKNKPIIFQIIQADQKIGKSKNSKIVGKLKPISSDFKIKDVISINDEIKLNSYIFGRQFSDGIIFDNLQYGNIFNDSSSDNSQTIEKVRNSIANNLFLKQQSCKIDQIVKLTLKAIYLQTNVKLSLLIINEQNKNQILRFSFNQELGLVIDDMVSNKQHYLDVNIFNSQKVVDIFFNFKKNSETNQNFLYISVAGLTFNDIIYWQKLSIEITDFSLQIDQHYLYNICKLFFDVYDMHDDQNKLKPSVDFINHHIKIYHNLILEMETNKQYFVQNYTLGSVCEVNKQQRSVSIFFYCDEYAAYYQTEKEQIELQQGYTNHEMKSFISQFGGYQDDLYIQKWNKIIDQYEKSKINKDFQHNIYNGNQIHRDYIFLELSEPDWCVYHAKIATRFMCGAGSNVNLQKARKNEQYRNQLNYYINKGQSSIFGQNQQEVRCRLVESPNTDDPEIDQMLDDAINQILKEDNKQDEHIKTDL